MVGVVGVAVRAQVLGEVFGGSVCALVGGVVSLVALDAEEFGKAESVVI